MVFYNTTLIFRHCFIIFIQKIGFIYLSPLTSNYFQNMPSGIYHYFRVFQFDLLNIRDLIFRNVMLRFLLSDCQKYRNFLHEFYTSGIIDVDSSNFIQISFEIILQHIGIICLNVITKSQIHLVFPKVLLNSSLLLHLILLYLLLIFNIISVTYFHILLTSLFPVRFPNISDIMS